MRAYSLRERNHSIINHRKSEKVAELFQVKEALFLAVESVAKYSLVEKAYKRRERVNSNRS